MTGLTLDTGALVALERRKQYALALIKAASERGQLITIPTPVVVEWWRGKQGQIVKLLAGFVIEPLSDRLARIAGEALGQCGEGPSVTDAVVMASAAQRGDVVITGDIEDLMKLKDSFFPEVVLRRV